MKLLIVFSLSACLLAAAEAKSKKVPPAKGAHTASAGTASNHEIPARAVRTADGSYRYADSKGTMWIYRKTPFGIARLEDKPADAAALAAESMRFDEVKAIEDGDTIRFERPGPFGIYKWQRNKTELDETEQTVWNRERPRTAGQD